MPSRHIPQAEAHRLLRRVKEIENLEKQRLNQWSKEYPGGGVNIETIRLTTEQWIRLDTVRRLDLPIVGKVNGQDLLIYAIKTP